MKAGQIVIEQQQAGPSVVSLNTSAAGIELPSGKLGTEALEWALDDGWKLAGQSAVVLERTR